MNKYTKEKSRNRIKGRSDLTYFLTYLTRGDTSEIAIKNLLSIIKSKRIIGSGESAHVSGNIKAVCFQDSPIHNILESIIHETNFKEDLGNKNRYQPIGLSFSKNYVYSKGGRPVIYENKCKAMGLITNPDEHWKIVHFDLSDDENISDWTHEREWRSPNDFTFELGEAYILLPNKEVYKCFMKNCSSEIYLNVAGIIVLSPIIS